MIGLRKSFATALVVTLVVTVSAIGETARENEGARVDRVTAAAAFQHAHPGARFYETAELITRVYGRAFSHGVSPEDSAERFRMAHADLFGLTPDDLDSRGPLADERHTLPLMFDPNSGSYKFTLVYYTHRVAGIKVFRSELRLLVRNEPGYPLVLASSSLRDPGAFDPGAYGVNDAAAGLDNARTAYPVLTRFENPQSVIWAGVENENAAPRLAYVFIGDNGMIPGTELARRLFVTDAATGAILLDEDQLQKIDVTGNVSAIATQGIGADVCEEEALDAMPYARVNIGATQVHADVDGDFVIPNGGSSEVTVVSPIRGQRFRVTNLGGQNTVESVQAIPPGPINIVHNAENLAEFDRGEVNAYIHANIVRDFVLDVSPNYPVIANQTNYSVTVNEFGGGLCPGNAQYTGNSLRFCAAGGNSPNTAWSSVVYHEYGHHLVAVGGAGQSQYGEGTGDMVSVLILDDPRLGLGFFGSCDQPLRDAEENVQYPCSGGHACAPLLSGCVWDTRNALAMTNPIDYMEVLSNLAINAILVHGPSQLITPQIAIDYATLDDDDDSLDNGSPHYAQIDLGFGKHNMGLPSFLDFAYPDGLPFTSDPNEGAEIVVEIVEGVGTLDDSSPTLHASVNGLPFGNISLNPIGDNLYVGHLPPSPCFAVIHWYVSAETTAGATVLSPPNAPTETFAATVITGVDPILTEDFENPVGYEVAGNIPSPFNGRWEVGIPVGGGTADPLADFDGSGQCYVTGNVAGKDVDGGPTILTTPVFDLSDGASYFINYARWFSNHTGLAPMSDVFVVEISNDDGATWNNLETIGPDGPEVIGGWIEASNSVDAAIEPTNQMRVRFLASDLGANSTVEAAIDAFTIGIGVCDAVDTFAPFIVHDDGETTSPFSGYVDPRSESTDGVSIDLGVDALAIRFSEPVVAVGGGDLTPDSFQVTGTGAGHPNVIAVDDTDDPVIELTLSSPIPLLEWTTVVAVVEDLSGNAIAGFGDLGPGVNEADRVDIAFLPGDIDQSGAVDPLDLLRFKQLVNGISTPDQGGLTDFIDVDRSGSVNPLDLLRFKQSINGVSPPSTQTWAGASLNNAQP